MALATGGEAGAHLATALAMPVSPDTLFRLIRSVPLAPPPEPRIVGINEWAWRKGVRYGTMIVDLERHRVAALLPERDADQVAAWLRAYPCISVVSRDRSATYADCGFTVNFAAIGATSCRCLRWSVRSQSTTTEGESCHDFQYGR